MGYLPAAATTSMSRETLLGDAKQVVLGQARAGYRPPPPRRIRVIGESGSETIMLTMKNLVGAHQISEHDAKIGAALARILSGGDVPAGSLVSEQAMLDLEREAFLSLCGEPKTRERIQHMLTTGKPLRN